MQMYEDNFFQVPLFFGIEKSTSMLRGFCMREKKCWSKGTFRGLLDVGPETNGTEIILFMWNHAPLIEHEQPDLSRSLSLTCCARACACLLIITGKE